VQEVFGRRRHAADRPEEMGSCTEEALGRLGGSSRWDPSLGQALYTYHDIPSSKMECPTPAHVYDDASDVALHDRKNHSSEWGGNWSRLDICLAAALSVVLFYVQEMRALLRLMWE
jgi:hypothetical protein